MTRSSQTLLLLGFFLAATCAGAYIFFGTELEEQALAEVALVPVSKGDPLKHGEVVVTKPREVAPRTKTVEPTTVLWPLELDLDIVSPSYLPESSEGQRPGAGRRARLIGNIADARGEPVLAKVEFVSGANMGRVLFCGTDGSFGANDLYPGLAIVRVSATGIVGSRREIVLRQNTEYTLNIGYGRPGAVQGEVVDAQGVGIEDAKVIIDGLATRTDAEGYFYLGGLASDRALLEIEAPGYSGVRDVVGITAEFTIPRGRLVYRLERSADLEIVLKTDIGAKENAQVVILPSDTKQIRRFPWYLTNPVEITPGTSITVRDLPVGAVTVRVYHRGALAIPAERLINLRSGVSNRVEVELQPAPVLRGIVTQNGKAVPGARVKLEAPDRVAATLSYFRTAHWFLESEVLPTFPFAVQEVLADGNGAFMFTAWPEVSESRYLEAWSLDGQAWGGRFVGPDDSEVNLEIQPLERGRAELHIDLPDRTQALEIKLTINGTPAESFSIAAGEDLVIDQLLEGTWNVKARWYDEVLLNEPNLELDGVRTLRSTLPERAIVGDNREAWERAGRVYPGPPL